MNEFAGKLITKAGTHDTVDWEQIHRDFPVVKNSVYLNAAGMSPLSKHVRAIAVDTLDLMCYSPKEFAESVLPTQRSTREAVARMYNADVEGIAFTQTTSLGMNILALHFRNNFLSKNRIVTLDSEFPSSTLPWAHQGFLLHYVRAEEDNTYSISKILEAIDDDTAAVVASYVQYNTGSKLDVHSLSKELKSRGIPFILNATQAAGIVPIDLDELPVSAFLTSGNKWVMAGVGASVMYVDKSLRDQRFPPFAGWVSADPIGFENRLGSIRNDGASLELGLISMVPIACLGASLGYILEIGVGNIQARLEYLSGYVIEKLLEKGYKVLTPLVNESRAGIVSIKMDDAAGFAAELKKQNIIVISRGDDLLRISPHIYNNVDDLDSLLSNL